MTSSKVLKNSSSSCLFRLYVLIPSFLSHPRSWRPSGLYCGIGLCIRFAVIPVGYFTQCCVWSSVLFWVDCVFSSSLISAFLIVSSQVQPWTDFKYLLFIDCILCRLVALVTILQAGRSGVRVPMRWNFSSFQPHYGPGVDSASNRNEYQEPSWGVKGAGA
jgi:hypothetical protein